MAGTGRDQYIEVAETIPFDNSANLFVSDNVQDAIEELFGNAAVSASPGFTWGASGNVTSNSWLLNDSVPSNKTGRIFTLYNGEIVEIGVSNEEPNTFTIEMYEHDGAVFTLLVSVTVTAARGGVFPVSAFVTRGKELAVKLVGGSAKNPIVQLIAKGTTSP